MDSAVLLQWVGALSPFILLALGAWFKRSLDRATAAKTHAEAEVQLAEAKQTEAETDSIVIANTKLLIEQAKAQQAEKDAIAAEKQAIAQSQIRSLTGRMARMEDYFAQMRAALATHGVWDAAALVDLRAAHPDYPDPPPFPSNFPPLGHHYDDDEPEIGADDYFGPTHRIERRRPHGPPIGQ